MKLRQSSRWPFPQVLLGVLSITLGGPAVAQIATVDATDPQHADLSWTIDPSNFVPDVPEYPTVIYAGDTRATGTQTITEPITSEAPVVTTEEADTYSLGSPRVYYTAPQEPAGPYHNYSDTDNLKFDLGPGPVAEGYQQILESTAYGLNCSFGWGDVSQVSSRDRGGTDPLIRDFCLPNGTPFYADLQNGLYEVTITAGDTITKTTFPCGQRGLWNCGGLMHRRARAVLTVFASMSPMEGYAWNLLVQSAR